MRGVGGHYVRWSTGLDSNPWPADLESDALPFELPVHGLARIEMRGTCLRITAASHFRRAVRSFRLRRSDILKQFLGTDVINIRFTRTFYRKSKVHDSFL